MDIKQSWLVTCARARFSLYEMRIIVKIVEQFQYVLKESRVKKCTRLREHCQDVRMTIPIRYLLDENSKHYEYVEEAAAQMCKRTVQFYDSRINSWCCSSIIFSVVHERKRGMLSFTVYGGFLDYLFDLTKGFSRYDFESVMRLRSPYSVRMAMMLSSQSTAQQYSILWLKKTFGVEDKYKQTGDFIKKCIAPAAEELNAVGGLHVEWAKVFGSRSITHVRFKCVRKLELDPAVAGMTEATAGMLPQDLKAMLMMDGGFTYRELNCHKPLLAKLIKHPCAADLVHSITMRARKDGKQKGWIIAALRNELK